MTFGRSLSSIGRMRSGNRKDPDLTDEAAYEHARSLTRRGMLRLSAGTGAGLAAGAGGALATAAPAEAATGIVKPLPPELFIEHGVAQWRGVRLSTVLRLAGITREAVDILPRGLDAEYVDKGENLGRVRRPLPVAKAMKDVLLAYEMNGATWRPARFLDRHPNPRGWVRWEFPWTPRASGRYELLARATDETGAAQPATAPYNTLGYLFGAVVRHPITVS